MNGFRCSSCGTLRRAFEVVIGEGHQGIACREHPDAPVVAWDRVHEWALVYVSDHAPVLEADGESLLEWAESYDLDEWPGVPRNVMAVVAVLFGRWGRHPERWLPERTDEQMARELHALYGSRK